MIWFLILGTKPAMQNSWRWELDQQGIGKMEGRADEDELSTSASSCNHSEGLLYLHPQLSLFNRSGKPHCFNLTFWIISHWTTDNCIHMTVLKHFYVSMASEFRGISDWVYSSLVAGSQNRHYGISRGTTVIISLLYTVPGLTSRLFWPQRVQGGEGFWNRAKRIKVRVT